MKKLDKLQKAGEEEVKVQEELEKIIWLVKGMCRQAGIPVYEPLNPELDRLIGGGG